MGASTQPRRGYSVLLLFSGPSSRKDSLAKLLWDRGISSREVDIVNVDMQGQNALDDATWEELCAEIRNGDYDFLFASPPCRTFSEARTVPPGPPVLRDHTHPYGFPKAEGKRRGLTHADYEKLREDNLLAERTAQACQLSRDAGGGYAVEQPWPWKGGVSMFDLAPFITLRRNGAQSVVFDQCMHGGDSPKPTQLLYEGAGFEQLEAKCTHAQGHPQVVQRRDRQGEFATKALAAYPPQLNLAIAAVIAEALLPTTYPSH